MKKLLIASSFLMLLFSCKQTSYITEIYIKNNIQFHKANETEDISIKPIANFSMPSSGGVYNIEFTGYNYKGAQGLVIGSDRKVIGKALITPVIERQFAVLTPAECKRVIEELNKGYDILKKKRVLGSEVYYTDYTPNKYIYFCVVKKTGGNPPVAQVWIGERKYEFYYNALLSKLERFLEWQEKVSK
jgi:hypothetical protein